MKILYRADKVSGVPAAWKEQYCKNGEWANYGSRANDKEEIYKALIACNPLTAEDANRIIGNNSWTSDGCDECGKDDCENLLQLGEEPDWESRTVNICSDCLNKAIELFKP